MKYKSLCWKPQFVNFNIIILHGLFIEIVMILSIKARDKKCL